MAGASARPASRPVRRAGRRTVVSAGPDPDAGGGALLMHISGMTGRPKGVLFSHASLLADGRVRSLPQDLPATDRGFRVRPIRHVNGLCGTMMGVLLSDRRMTRPDFDGSASGRQASALRLQLKWFSKSRQCGSTIE